MELTVIFTSMADDLSAGDVILYKGEHHIIRGEAEDDGDVIHYRTENLDGGEDDVSLEPGPVDVYEVS